MIPKLDNAFAALNSGVKKVLHVSSIAAIGGKPNDLITEETKWEKASPTVYYE